MSAKTPESFGYVDLVERTILRPSSEPSLYFCRRLIAGDESPGKKWMLEITKRLEAIGKGAVDNTLWRYPIPSVTMGDCAYGVTNDESTNGVKIRRITTALGGIIDTEKYQLSEATISIALQNGGFYGYQIALKPLEEELSETGALLCSQPDVIPGTIKPIRNAHITVARPSLKVSEHSKSDVGGQIHKIMSEVGIDHLVLDRPEVSYWL